MKRTTTLIASFLLAALTLAALLARGGAGGPADPVADPAGEAAPGSALAAQGTSTAPATRAGVAGDTSCSYHLASGAGLRFRWTSRTETKLGSTDGGMEAGPAFVLAGDLLVTGLGTRGDDLVVELRFSGLKVDTLGPAAGDVAAAAAATLRKDLEAGTLVRLTRQGRILGYGFADGLQPESRNWLRTVACACRLTLGAAADEAWTCEEADETGKALCEQRWTGPESDHRRPWARKKLRYVDGTEREPRPELESRSAGTFDLVLGWPGRAAGEQHAKLEVAAMGLRVESRFEFSCELVEAGSAPAVARAADRPTDAGLTGALDVAQAHEASVAAEFRALLERVPTNELIQKLLEIAKGDLASPELMAARENLVWALKLWPERVADVLSAVHGGGLEDQGLMVLLSALGAAKHDTAQKALVECCAASEGEKTRVFALRALFQVDRPAAATVEAVRAAARGEAGSLVATTGLLLLGRFADGDGPQHQALLALEAEAVTGRRVDSWLLALGNARSADALPAVQRHAGAEDPNVRAAAIDALGALPGAAALGTLAERARDEADPNVRAHAAETLAAREEPASLRLVDELLVRDQDPDVRIAALRSLTHKPDSEAQRLLARSAQSDPVARVRTFASEAMRR